jgi:hypothetical protein
MQRQDCRLCSLGCPQSVARSDTPLARLMACDKGFEHLLEDSGVRDPTWAAFPCGFRAAKKVRISIGVHIQVTQVGMSMSALPARRPKRGDFSFRRVNVAPRGSALLTAGQTAGGHQRNPPGQRDHAPINCRGRSSVAESAGRRRERSTIFPTWRFTGLAGQMPDTTRLTRLGRRPSSQQHILEATRAPFPDCYSLAVTMTGVGHVATPVYRTARWRGGVATRRARSQAYPSSAFSTAYRRPRRAML